MPLIKRRHALFCSQACRKAASRAAKRLGQSEKPQDAYPVTCRVCDESWNFDDCPPDKVYCSTRCRTRAWRRRLTDRLTKVHRHPDDPQR